VAEAGDDGGGVATTVGGLDEGEGCFPVAHEASVTAATAQSVITGNRGCIG
jgi:hypothetical protein